LKSGNKGRDGRLINNIPRSNIEDRSESIEDIGVVLFQSASKLVLDLSWLSERLDRRSLPLI
jgi:hypothetical protein